MSSWLSTSFQDGPVLRPTWQQGHYRGRGLSSLPLHCGDWVADRRYVFLKIGDGELRV